MRGGGNAGETIDLTTDAGDEALANGDLEEGDETSSGTTRNRAQGAHEYRQDQTANGSERPPSSRGD